MKTQLLKFLAFCIFFIHADCYAQGSGSKPKKITFIGNDFSAVYKTVERYRSYYTAISNVQLRMTDKLNEEDFRSLFDDVLNSSDAKEIIPHDFPDTSDLRILGNEKSAFYKMNLHAYVSALAASMAYNDYNFIYSCSITPMDSVYYCNHGSFCYAWVRKRITYKQGDTEKYVVSISRLTLNKMPGRDSFYKITSVDTAGSFPKDDDHDFIANDCDWCTESDLASGRENILTLHGCADADLDGANPPSSRFTVTLSGGPISAFNNEFTDKDIKGGNAVIKPGYFNKTGFSVDLSAIYTLNALLGLRFGFLFSHNSLDSKQLESTVNSFMQNNGYTTPIQLNNVSRQLLIPHIDIRIGQFNKIRNALSFELTGGLAVSNLSFLNKDLILYRVDSLQGNNGNVSEELAHISFKTSPFPVVGGRINYEYGLGDGTGRFFISAYYLRGNYSFSNQEITAPSGNKIIFEGSSLQLWGASAGICFNLLKPRKWEELRKLHDPGSHIITLDPNARGNW